MADKTTAAGGPSGSSSGGSGGSGAAPHPRSVPGLAQVVLDLFGHKLGNRAVEMVLDLVGKRTDRAEHAQKVRLPNFGHVMTWLQAQHPIVFAQICDLMQFLGNDDDRADFQYHVAGIGGDEKPQPSVDFLIQLAGMAKSTGGPGLQEMKDYLLQLGYIGPRSEDQLEKARRYAKLCLTTVANAPGNALGAAKTQLTAVADGLEAAVAASQIPKAAADFRTKMAAYKARARARW